jgi:hypothetical protein
MKKINILFILTICVLSPVKVFSNNSNHSKTCNCHDSTIVTYYIYIKEAVEEKLAYIPSKSRKIAADGIIIIESAYNKSKNVIYDGVGYVKGYIQSVLDWAHEINTK